ncbi:LacI family transcriptional regulator [Tessaracoccus sp. OS52]|uniref:LacI family DNA-binding transcriptional regulator n=1 Tax=Tessaracoccus sp. OS52 TaxID=2886691 RepID=UPI001D105963|nr:LacI family DNA-binding transcriptional regulator [Tessaracoccus sp. OS52]MCC2591857.1 LacI family transcriptional regulator [Tessaracoccus sp. OS52]
MQPRNPGVTLRDVAQRAGVAVSTVSNVLNRPESVAPQTRLRVTQAIKELGYIRNEAARVLRLGLSRVVGLVVSEVSSPFFSQMSQAIGRALAADGYAMLLGDSLQDQEIEDRLIRLFESQRVQGLICAPAAASSSVRSMVADRGLPLVYLDHAVEDSQGCSVSVDNIVGASLVIRHLHGIGKRRVAVIRGSAELPQITERVAGAQAAAAECGIELEVLQASSYFVEGGVEAGTILASRKAGARPDAVFAVNDSMALGALSAVVDRGISVPDEMAVVGYDDVAMATMGRVPLTTVRQPATGVGLRAAALMVAELEDDDDSHVHERTVFTPELVIRESTVRS